MSNHRGPKGRDRQIPLPYVRARWPGEFVEHDHVRHTVAPKWTGWVLGAQAGPATPGRVPVDASGHICWTAPPDLQLLDRFGRCPLCDEEGLVVYATNLWGTVTVISPACRYCLQEIRDARRALVDG